MKSLNIALAAIVVLTTTTAMVSAADARPHMRRVCHMEHRGHHMVRICRMSHR